MTENRHKESHSILAPKTYFRTSNLILPHSIPLFTSPEKDSMGYRHHNSPLRHSQFSSQSWHLPTLNYNLKRLNEIFLKLACHNLKLSPKKAESGAVVHPAPSHLGINHLLVQSMASVYAALH